MDRFQRNYWSLNIDFIHLFKDVHYGRIPIPLFIRFNHLFKDENIFHQKKLSSCIRHRISKEKQIQPAFERYINTHLDIQDRNTQNNEGKQKKIVFFRDSKLRISRGAMREHFNLENTIILQENGNHSKFKGMQVDQLFGNPSNKLYKTYKKKSAALKKKSETAFSKLDKHPVFSCPSFQRAYFRKIPKLTKQLVYLDHYLTLKNVSCLIAADTSTRRVLQLFPRSKGVSTISMQHGLILGWQARMPVLATVKAVYGNSERKMYMKKGVQKESIALIGHPRFDQRFNTENSLEIHAFKNNCQIKDEHLMILIATQPNDMQRNWHHFITYIAKTTSFNLLLKPHPKESDLKIYKKLCSKYANVHLLPKNVALYQCIPNIDAVIIHSSTVGLEAMLLQKPILVMQKKKMQENNVYYNRKILGNLVESDPKILTHVLEKIWSDDSYADHIQSKTNRFLKIAYPHTNQLSIHLLKDIIYKLTVRDDHLKKEEV